MPAERTSVSIDQLDRTNTAYAFSMVFRLAAANW